MNLDLQKAQQLLDERLRKAQKPFTLNEAAAATGLSIDITRDAFEQLLKKYLCRLQVTENGDLIYDFGKSLRRRNARTPREHIEAVGQWLWKALTVVSKAWIAVTLVVYFILFLVVMIALVVISSAGKGDRGGRGRGIPINFGSLANIFFAIFRWRTITGTTLYKSDPLGYRYRKYQPSPGTLNQNKKSFIASVYDFVFGPPRPRIESLHNQQEVAAYLQDRNGIIVTAELSGLAGWTFPQAETFLTDCLVRFEGEVKVSENGVMYGQFDQLLRRIGQMEAGKIVWYWDEYEPEYEVTGNSVSRNMAIGLMNGFNLVFALLVVSGAMANALPLDPSNELAMVISEGIRHLFANRFWPALFLGWLPMFFSSLFFIIPAVRSLKVYQANRQRRENNIRKRLYKVIFKSKGAPRSIDEIVQMANEGAPEEKLTVASLEGKVKDLALDMPGETVVSEEGLLKFAFPRIAAELEDAKFVRAHHKIDHSLGEVIVDSDS